MKIITSLLLVIFSSVANLFAQPIKIVSFTIPSTGVVTGGLPPGCFRLQENNEVVVPVTVTLNGNALVNKYGTGSYMVSYAGVSWLLQNKLASQENLVPSKFATKTNPVFLSGSGPLAFKPSVKRSGPVALTVSTSAVTPHAGAVAADGTEDNEGDEIPLLVFDLRSGRQAVVVEDVTVKISTSGASALVTKAYLYDGSSLIAIADCSGGFARFEDIDMAMPGSHVKSMTLKVDIREAVYNVTFIKASVSGCDIKLASKRSSQAAGSAVSAEIPVWNIGAVARAENQPHLMVNTVERGDSVYHFLTATYYIRIKAVGDDLIFGPPSDIDSFRFTVYRNGVPVE